MLAIIYATFDMMSQLRDVPAVSEIIDEPIENMVGYIHWHDLLDKCTVPDSIKGAGKVHGLSAT